MHTRPPMLTLYNIDSYGIHYPSNPLGPLILNGSTLIMIYSHCCRTSIVACCFTFTMDTATYELRSPSCSNSFARKLDDLNSHRTHVSTQYHDRD